MPTQKDSKKTHSLTEFLKTPSSVSLASSGVDSPTSIAAGWIPSGGLIMGNTFSKVSALASQIPSILPLDWGYRLSEFLTQNISLAGDHRIAFLPISPSNTSTQNIFSLELIKGYKQEINSNFQQRYPIDKWNLLNQAANKPEKSSHNIAESPVQNEEPSSKKTKRKTSKNKGFLSIALANSDICSKLDLSFDQSSNPISIPNDSSTSNSISSTPSSLPSLVIDIPDLLHIFTPQYFGYSFISHAHADHSPGGYSGWINDQDFGPLYPLPVLATKSTLELIRTRFQASLPNCILPQSSSPEAMNIQQMLVPSFARYMAWAKGHPLVHSMLSEYFNPFPIQSMWAWFIPNGHIFGSAGLCLATKEWLEKHHQFDSPVKSKPLSVFQTPQTESPTNNSINSSLTTSSSNLFSSPSSPSRPSDLDLRIPAEIIYLNEFNPLPRPHTLPCPPVRCQELLIDALFADPRKSFPNPEQEFARLLAWIQQELQSHPVILFCRELGKPQWVIGAIGQHPDFFSTIPDAAIVVDAAEKRILEYCANQGMVLPPILTKSEARARKYPQTKNYLLITEPKDRDSPAIQKIITERGAVTAEMTGWCIEPSFREEYPADAYFCLSDHIPFAEFRSYLEMCEFDTLTLLDPPTPLIGHQLQSFGWNVRILPGISEKIYDPDFF